MKFTADEKAHIVVEIFTEYSERFPGSFTVIGKNKLRIKEIAR